MNRQPPARILIADDEPLYLRTTGDLLRKAGYDCVCVPDANQAIAALQTGDFDLILSDLNMPGNLTLELLHEGRRNWSHVPLIVVTGVPSLPTAIESIRLGITDYLLKPVRFEELLASVRRALAHSSGASAVAERSEQDRLDLAAKFPELIGRSAPMLELFDVIDRVAATDTNVLITGESGTGKEVVAKAIHRHSQRSAHRFQVIDCTAIPEQLFESVLFGHARGAFTGAVKDQAGLLSECHGGTAFFDELGELPGASQAKLLRAIQEQTFTPVGKTRPIEVDKRFICATNRDLALEVNAGRFRRDLFYRLGVIHIELPPLRERGEDVVLLADYFLQQLQSRNPEVESFSGEVISCFRRYDWPGNIRELRNVIERALVMARARQIELADLPPAMQDTTAVGSNRIFVLGDTSREEALDNAEHLYLRSLLDKHGGNISQAAQQAGLSRQGMHKLLKKHNIAASDYRDS